MILNGMRARKNSSKRYAAQRVSKARKAAEAAGTYEDITSLRRTGTISDEDVLILRRARLMPIDTIENLDELKELGSDDTCLERLQEREVHEAIRRLPQKHWNVLDMRIFNDMTASEIAKTLEIGTENIKQQIRQGLKILRQDPIITSLRST